MSFNIEAACGCVMGNSREKNEDNFYFKKKHLQIRNKGLKSPLKFSGNTDDTILLAVFDGMGGGSNGEEASFKASEVFSEEVKQLDRLVIGGKELLINLCRKANESIYAISKEKQVGTMGTTVAALYFPQDEVFACNIGDSKIFRIRAGRMMQISEDHTDEKIMNGMGVIKKPVLLQYLGAPDEDISIMPFISKGDLCSGDIYIICSDGITDTIMPAEIYEICKNSRSSEDAVKNAINLFNIRIGSDNATIIIAKVL